MTLHLAEDQEFAGVGGWETLPSPGSLGSKAGALLGECRNRVSHVEVKGAFLSACCSPQIS